MPNSNESATQVIARRRLAWIAEANTKLPNADECDRPHDAPDVAWIVVTP